MRNFVKITTESLDVAAITNLVSDPTTGAISLFIGTTRNDFDGKKVIRLDYEAYIPMAEKKITQLCDSIRSKWPNKIHNIAIYHRLGRVEPTEASVIIAITSAHRKESLDSVQYAIDKLKATVPIWKKEIYEEDIGAEWKENKECTWSTSAKKNIPPADDKKEEIRNDVSGNDEGMPNNKTSSDIDPKYVQITASNQEIERRIEAFIERKREEINTNNVLEFCSRHPVNDEPNEFSCARTDSIGLIKKKDSASHLRKSSVDNSKAGVTTKSQGKVGSDKPVMLPFGIEERVLNVEEHLKLRPIQKELYLRLKDIEDRVLYLEGISPEYFDGIPKTPHTNFIPKDGQNDCSPNKKKEAEIGHQFDNDRLDSAYNRDLQIENTEYNQALSRSLCGINKRIQELQTKLKNASGSMQ